MTNKKERQLTLRGVLIGSLGSVIITTSSMFIALKLSSLPWPIIFVALFSMFSLKLLGNTNYGEINATHTAMSAGAMVAGGLAFTVPGIWILYPDQTPNLLELMAVSIGGTVLGLIFTAVLRHYFIDERDLEYPMGQAAADTIVAGDEGGLKSVVLFISMGISGLFAYIRDILLIIPQIITSKTMTAYGSSFGIYFSPMLIGVGYLLGPVLMGVWFLGSLIGDFGILFGGENLLGWSVAQASSVKSSLGIGLMVGSGIGVLLERIIAMIRGLKTKNASSILSLESNKNKWLSIVAIICAISFVFLLDFSLITSIIVVFGTLLATTMSSECVGRTGINPMEIFGIIILLFTKALCNVDGPEAFYVAAIVAVAAGLTGDVMNDFKAGRILNSDPRAQWISEAIGGLIGAVVSVFTLFVIYKAYGAGAIGGPEFPAAQANAVASMVGGISCLPAFIVGLVSAVVLYLIKFPVMTLGLGIYLPFYMSATAAIGGLIAFIVGRFKIKEKADVFGSVIASGLLGGEAIVGVIVSIVIAFNAI
ncbi:MAG: peptide transporter [Clostridiales bacterium]|nr:peptide transporter [Clostridiales bacterium]